MRCGLKIDSELREREKEKEKERVGCKIYGRNGSWNQYKSGSTYIHCE